MNTFELIRGTKDIAKFMGFSEDHTGRNIIPDMKSYNCVFKQSRKKTSPWITSPFFINLYLFLKGQKSD